MRRPKRTRIKSPFCTGTELVVLRAVRAHPDTYVNEMARLIEMSNDTFAHALTDLVRSGHLLKDQYGLYSVTETGECLIDCARKIERARKRKS
jgi:hypothetical protein